MLKTENSKDVVQQLSQIKALPRYQPQTSPKILATASQKKTVLSEQQYALVSSINNMLQLSCRYKYSLIGN